MKRLAKVLAISAGSLVIVAVGTVYFLQNHPVWQAYWAYFHTTTNRALLLGGVLLFLAFVLKRFGTAVSPQTKYALNAAALGLLCVSTVFLVSSGVEIKRKMAFEPIAAEAIYKFSFDGISTNVPVWSKHLAEFKGKPSIHALEIGSYEGRSALWFLTNILTHESSSITCVDLFPEDIDSTFDGNVKASGLSHKIVKLKGYSNFVVRNLDKKFDFVYVDGSHVAKDVLIDAVLAWDLVKPGGMMIFDDYGFRRFSEDNPSTALIPRPAIDAFLTAFHHHIEILHQDYQVIIRKRAEPDLGPEDVWVRLKSLFF
jgi:hypothetical protein